MIYLLRPSPAGCADACSAVLTVLMKPNNNQIKKRQHQSSVSAHGLDHCSPILSFLKNEGLNRSRLQLLTTVSIVFRFRLRYKLFYLHSTDKRHLTRSSPSSNWPFAFTTETCCYRPCWQSIALPRIRAHDLLDDNIGPTLFSLPINGANIEDHPTLP